MFTLLNNRKIMFIVFICFSIFLYMKGKIYESIICMIINIIGFSYSMWNNPDIIRYAMENNINKIKQILPNKKIINKTLRSQGMTALMFAVANENIEMVKLLLDNQANINIIAKKIPHSALSLNAVNGNIEIANLLLGAGAKVNLGESLDGDQALAIAASRGYSNFVKRLLIEKPDIYHRNIFGQKASDYAKENGYIDIYNLLV